MTKPTGRIAQKIPAQHEVVRSTMSLVGQGARPPNLLVRTVKIAAGVKHDEVLDTVAGQLKSAVGKMAKDTDEAPFTFADNREGRRVTFVFAQAGVEIRQHNAIRVDEDRVSTLTITSEAGVDEKTEAAYMASLASARPSMVATVTDVHRMR